MRARQFITEYRRDLTAQNLGQALLAKFFKESRPWQERVIGLMNDSTAILNTLLQYLEAADPTPNKQYVQWIARTYVNDPQVPHFEDIMTKVTEPLSNYFRLVRAGRISQPYNDINRIKSLRELETLVQHEMQHEPLAAQKDRGQAKEVYRDADLRIIVPEDQTAACYYGQGTRWCTAATNNNMFLIYNTKGPLYIIIPKHPKESGEKYQFHFPTYQFMDQEDHSIDISELVNRYPQLREIFHEQAQRFHVLEFLYNDRELNTLSDEIHNVMVRAVHQYVPETTPDTVRGLVEEVKMSNPAIGEYINISQFRKLAAVGINEQYENLIESIVSHICYSSAAYAGDRLRIFDDYDRLVEVVESAVGDWLNEEEFYSMVSDLEDQDLEYEVANSVVHFLVDRISVLLQELYEEALVELGIARQ